MMFNALWSIATLIKFVFVSGLILSAVYGIVLCLSNRAIPAAHKVGWVIAFLGSGIVGLLVYLAVFSSKYQEEINN